MKELCEHHISGQLKVAPEHISDNVLTLMGKPENSVYERFKVKYNKMNETVGKSQFVVPYLISSHPGSTLKEAVELAEYLRDLGYMPEQVQDFYPTPSTISTCMYYTGLDPKTMKEIYVPKSPHEKAMQRALIQYRNPKNYDLVVEALKKADRADLIGFHKMCLIRPRQFAKEKQWIAKEGKDKSNSNKTNGNKTSSNKYSSNKTTNGKTTKGKTTSNNDSGQSAISNRSESNRAESNRAESNSFTSNRAESNRSTSNRAESNRSTSNRAESNRSTSNKAGSYKATSYRTEGNKAASNGTESNKSTSNKSTSNKANSYKGGNTEQQLSTRNGKGKSQDSFHASKGNNGKGTDSRANAKRSYNANDQRVKAHKK